MFGVHYYLVAAHVTDAVCGAATDTAPVAELAATAGTACVALVNTSVYLKPTEKVFVPELSDSEIEAWRKSCEHVKGNIDQLGWLEVDARID